MSDKEKQDNMLAMKAMNEFAIEDDESIRYKHTCALNIFCNGMFLKCIYYMVIVQIEIFLF